LEGEGGGKTKKVTERSLHILKQGLIRGRHTMISSSNKLFSPRKSSQIRKYDLEEGCARQEKERGQLTKDGEGGVT